MNDQQPTLSTITFIRAHGLEALNTKYRISAKRHSKYASLVQLRYSQYESPFHEPIVQECRGLLLDESRNWEVVAFPYTKFFNFGYALITSYPTLHLIRPGNRWQGTLTGAVLWWWKSWMVHFAHCTGMWCDTFMMVSSSNDVMIMLGTITNGVLPRHHFLMRLGLRTTVSP